MAKKLFVGSLSWNTNDDGLRQAFEPFGEVVEAKVITDRDWVGPGALGSSRTTRTSPLRTRSPPSTVPTSMDAPSRSTWPRIGVATAATAAAVAAAAAGAGKHLAPKNTAPRHPGGFLMSVRNPLRHSVTASARST